MHDANFKLIYRAYRIIRKKESLIIIVQFIIISVLLIIKASKYSDFLNLFFANNSLIRIIEEISFYIIIIFSLFSSIIIYGLFVKIIRLLMQKMSNNKAKKGDKLKEKKRFNLIDFSLIDVEFFTDTWLVFPLIALLIYIVIPYFIMYLFGYYVELVFSSKYLEMVFTHSIITRFSLKILAFYFSLNFCYILAFKLFHEGFISRISNKIIIKKYKINYVFAALFFILLPLVIKETAFSPKNDICNYLNIIIGLLVTISILYRFYHIIKKARQNKGIIFEESDSKDLFKSFTKLP